jgi:hypothetical protein
MRAAGQRGPHSVEIARRGIFAVEARDAEGSVQTKQPISARLGATG